ncbi:MAG: hypothetical protein ABSB95_11305 [Dissulfurispiraceae bacterium]|jgi:ribosomal protein L20
MADGIEIKKIKEARQKIIEEVQIAVRKNGGDWFAFREQLLRAGIEIEFKNGDTYAIRDKVIALIDKSGWRAIGVNV